MFRKLRIFFNSFYVKWIRGERNKRSLNYFNQYLFDWMIINKDMLNNKIKEKEITYYKNGKEYKRTFKDMNK